MIKFSCKLCGEKLSVQDQFSGKRIKCPKCNNTCVVPAESPRIKFDCPNCGRRIRVLQIHAGKKGQCPKCKSPLVVPSLKGDPGEDSGTVTVVCPMCNERVRAPKDSQERFVECPACGSNVESSLGAEPPESDSSIPPSTDEDQYEEDSDLPEEDEGPNRRLTLAICGAAVVVVVGLIILITVILPSGSGPAEEREEMRQEREVTDGDSSPQSVAADTRPTGAFTLEPPKENVARTEPTISPAAATNAASNNALELRLKPGWRHALRMVVESNITQETVKGERLDISSVKTTELEFEVEDVDPNGAMRLKVTYLAIKEKGQGAGEQMEYDSTTPDVSTDYPFGPMYLAMIGKSFMAKVTPEGRMIGLEGVDQMYLAIAETIVQGEDDATRKRISERMTEGVEERVRRSIERANERHGSRQKRVEMVRGMLKKNPFIAEEQIAEMVGNLIVAYPGRAVETGDSWQAKKALFSLGTVDLDCTYTLKEKTPAVMVVGVSSKIELDNELASAKGSSLGSTRTTLTGSYEGTVQIDPSSGWMVHKNATMRCSGEVTILPNEQMPQGMTLPVTMEIVITVEPME